MESGSFLKFECNLEARGFLTVLYVAIALICKPSLLVLLSLIFEVLLRICKEVRSFQMG